MPERARFDLIIRLTGFHWLPVLALVFLCMRAPSLLAQAPTPVPVPTWRYDLTHAGQNTNETALTPVNVNATLFGKLFSVAVDGNVYAQPLYLPGLTMSDGLVHNVLFVATENDSVYAFDADTNGGANANPLWQVSLLTSAHGAGAGATAIPWQDTGTSAITPTIGITGTPTINAAKNTLYVVAATKENGAYFSRLHAINIITGAEQTNSPATITATVAGTGNGSSGGQLSFSPLWENQRPALNYYNGYVYFGYAANGDNGPWHGWVFAYDATTLTQSKVLCLTPNGIGAGIWASGAGMPIDEDAPGGRMFVVTGNGTVSTYLPFDSKSEFSEGVVTLNLANGGLTPTDSFTSFNYGTLTSHDLDLGSGGVLMVPDNTGPNPHILIGGGKEGRILVLNRDNLGGYVAGASSNTNVLQDISTVVPEGYGFWSTPAYWNGQVYFWPKNNVGMMFKLNNGVLDTQPDSLSTVSSAYPGASFSLSSSGTENGIAWAVWTDAYAGGGPAVLYAWNANDLTKTIYQSNTNSQRDAAGPAIKFSVPVVTNGKVYVPANGEVDVYGLFNGEPNAAAPVITPNGGSFKTSQSVQLSTTTPAASIYYTLDGSLPTPASTLYTAPITISTDTTIRAITSASGYVQSGVKTATFTFADQTPAVTLTPAGGTYASAQTVTLTDTDTSASIYYTTDGSTPTSSSSLYANPIQVAISQTVNAIAIDPALQNSNVTTAAYVIQNSGTTINFSGGFASTTGLTLNGSAVANDDTRLQLTNGGLNQAGSTFWSTPINIQAFTTSFLFQLSNAQGNGFTFTVQNVGATALGADSTGLGYQGILKSVAIKFNFLDFDNEGADSTGIYTNGQAPTLPTVDLTPSGIVLGSGDSIQAQVTYDGTTLTLNLLDLVTLDKFTLSQAINIPAIVGGNTAYVGFTGGSGTLSSSQKILSWTYATQSVPPVFTPPAGTYSAAQNVSLSSATADATIYYTTDGSTPTAASTKYSNPIAVSASETINAIAISQTYGSSNVAAAAYVIQASTPIFTPGAGTYTSQQMVTITDATPGATIYYAINETPTTSSTKYIGPITVSSTETIKAIAVASGYTSAVATAAYTIPGANSVLPTPTLSLATGNYTTAQTLTITDAVPGATIYYTMDDTLPTTSSPKYTGPITISSTEAVIAIATAPGYTNSAKASGIYLINNVLPTPTILPAGGTYTTPQTVTIREWLNTDVYYTTDGTTPTTTSTRYTGPFTVNSTETIKAIVIAAHYTNSAVATAAYTIPGANSVLPTPTLSLATGNYTTAQTLTITDAASGATIYYTMDDTLPTTSSPKYTGPITISSTEAVIAIATAPGYTNSAKASGIYLINNVLPTPTILPAGGTYTTPQTVTIREWLNTDVYYTTDGTTPTTTSTRYTGPFTVNSTETIKAIVIAAHYTNSAVATAAYTIPGANSVLPTPTLSLATGNYTTAQTLTITDAASGATIYYTMDDTLPTTSSPKYTGPITISSTEAVIAIATAPGYTNSAKASGIYLINNVLPTPTILPAGGTYTTPQTVTIREWLNTDVYYTTDGTTPTTTSTRYTGPFTVNSTETIKAIVIAAHYTNSAVATAAYTISN